MKWKLLRQILVLGSFSYNVHAAIPTAIPQAAIVIVNSTTNVVTLAGIDSGNLALTFNVPATSAHGTITFISRPTTSSALYYYTPNSGYIGSDSYTFTVTNTLLQTSLPATVSIIVTDIAPTAIPQTAIVVKNSVNNILTLNGTDSEGQTLTFSAPATSTHGTLAFVSNPSTSSALYYYTPTSGYSGADSFTFTVENTSLQTSSPATVSLTVTAITPVAPTAVPQTAIEVVNSVNNIITLNGIDPAGQTLTFNVPATSTHGVLAFVSNPSTSSALYYYTPTAGYSGADAFDFTVTNTSLETSAPATVSITMTDLAPTALPQLAIFVVDSINNTLTLIGTDPGNQALTFTVPATSTNGTLTFVSNPSAATALYHYTPDALYVGSDSFTFTVTNPSSQTSSPATVTLAITSGDIPVANPRISNTIRNLPISINLSGSDSVGTPITFSIVSGPSRGTLGSVVSTGNFTATVRYAPSLGYKGSDAFVFKVSNGVADSFPATVTITVFAVSFLDEFVIDLIAKYSGISQ